ncbi:MAG: serine/threonine protein kinase, partial [Planctomycetes bacterium]|nr:serine/threonine protein kinase [Planctomycetota bacterium]
MDADRWREIRELLENTVDLSPAEREAYLSRSCGGDVTLRSEVETLLAGSDNAPTFLDTPALAAYADVIGMEQASSLVGQHIGPYQLVRYIASGGMGAVYLATSPDSRYGKEVAVKLIRRRTLTPDTLRRFRIERQALAALHHPHIAALLDGGVTDTGLPYLVMEYVDGPPIDKYCDEKRFSTNERLELFRAVCSGVAYAHRNLIVHRDLKPNNILVTSQGIPKLLDFGIAKVLDPHAADQPGETTTRNRILTPEYASPEHIRGDAITTASDVYSLGVILYGLLTGQCPYRFKSRIPHEIERTICEQDPEKPSTTILRTVEALSPDEGSHSTSTPESVSKLRSVTPVGLRRQLAGDLDAIILMSLRKEPHRRYSSVEQFSDDIHCHLQGL